MFRGSFVQKLSTKRQIWPPLVMHSDPWIHLSISQLVFKGNEWLEYVSFEDCRRHPWFLVYDSRSSIALVFSAWEAGPISH